jgi:serine/threonine protein phosphatase PrpC
VTAADADLTPLDAVGTRFGSHARSHSGARRTANEDRMLDRPDLGFWAVADGMGGLASGDLAAEQVTGAVAAAAGRTGSGYARLNRLVAALEQVNTDIFRRTAKPQDASGSTVVALLAHEGHFACLWAGDSRAYLYRAGELKLVTRDHSVVQQLVDDGVVSETARRAHPFSHVLTRAVGTSGSLEIDRSFGAIQAGDVFLLCSDGLTNALSDAEIARALDHAAADNVSVVLVRQT